MRDASKSGSSTSAWNSKAKQADSAPALQFGDAWGKTGLFLLFLDALKKRLKIADKTNGAGQANTALVYHAQRILALHEGDLPYQVG